MTGKLSEIVASFLYRAITLGEVDVVEEAFGDFARLTGLQAEALHGKREMLRFQRLLLSQYKNIGFEVQKSIEEGDWVALRCVFTGTYRESPYQMEAQCMARIVAGKIAEMHFQGDYMRLFEQTGHLPHNSRDMCLLGAQFRLAGFVDQKAN
ncbi:SnoaL-like polyketide cyclase [Rhodovulum imhoffii]|uniref:SnoaL-like polyketide cyclase n=1 Tax=Rhodovulum imhoffii TaxID=365340 RepID=A0A2T5BPZ7_9RHOB|nr:ester cyclase [Rhodovulum imhoffii]MBK5934090.1 hypothetical protein [Rhodovulum imhoffii]PTN01159.1 SnoaL-like polyketide cyclase [Rhodovulum imhoffii]